MFRFFENHAQNLNTLQNNSVSWDLQMGFNSAFKGLNINSKNCAFHWFVLYNHFDDHIKKNGMGRKCSMYGGGCFGVEI
jgi:hypothetical protein